VYKLLPDNRPDSSVGLTARNHTEPMLRFNRKEKSSVLR
jgi:hypothetical protein